MRHLDMYVIQIAHAEWKTTIITCTDDQVKQEPHCDGFDNYRGQVQSAPQERVHLRKLSNHKSM